MKVAVIGAGHVGATCAQRIAEADIADVHLVDIAEGLAAGKALDLSQAAPVVGHSRRITGSSDYEPIAGSDIVVITAGVPRKPGMSREDLLETNGRIVADISRRIAQLCPSAIVIMVTNPLDVTTYICHRVTGLPASRCMGMAGILDSARLRCFLAWEIGCSPEDVEAMVLGGHGDSMVPIISHATAGGIPVAQLLSQERLEAIIERTRNAGAEIVSLLKAGSAFYAPAAAVAQMVEAIARDQKRLLPASVLLSGQYGIDGVFVGVPVVLGSAGVEKIVEMDLPEDELAALRRSAEHVRATVETWHKIAGDDPSRW